MKQINLILAGQADRKKDNLFSMLESIEAVNSIQLVDDCADVDNIIKSEIPVIVMVDYRNPEEDSDKKISQLILNRNVEHIVLLKSCNSPESHFTHYTTSELFYDEVSTEILTNLLKNIQMSY